MNPWMDNYVHLLNKILYEVVYLLLRQLQQNITTLKNVRYIKYNENLMFAQTSNYLTLVKLENLRIPLDSIRDVVLTVSPNRQYLGIFIPTTPTATGPEWIPAAISK